jgi:hypothetical protein
VPRKLIATVHRLHRPAGRSIARIAQMQELDIAALEAAFEGTPAGSR